MAMPAMEAIEVDRIRVNVVTQIGVGPVDEQDYHVTELQVARFSLTVD